MLAAGKLRMAAGAGAGAGSVSITDQSLSSGGAGLQEITYQASSAGTIRRIRNSDPTTLETWLLSGSASSYEIRATLAGGDALSSGVLGSWLGLGSTREWTQLAGGIGEGFSSLLTIEIRLAASPFTVLDTASVTLTATSF